MALPEQAAPRTLADVVIDLVGGVGEAISGDVADGREVTRQAVDACNDAIAEIWMRAQWPFRLRMAPVYPEASQMYYQLPADFSEPAWDVGVANRDTPLQYVKYEDLLKSYPWLRSFPADVMNLTWLIQVNEQHRGAPLLYSHLAMGDTEYLVLFPIPTTEWIDSYLSSHEQTTSSIMVGYYCLPPVIKEPTANLPLPSSLWQAHKYMALAYLKQGREHPDYQADEARAERYISRALASMQKRHRRGARFRVDR